MNDQDMRENIFADFNNFLTKRYDGKENSEYFQNHIHVSSLSACKRQVVMDYYNFDKKQKTTAEMLMFEIANFVHRLMADWARESDQWEVIGEEMEVGDGLPELVTGRLDLFIRHKETGNTVLFDVKTVNPNAFQPWAAPIVKPEHELQVSTYKAALQKLQHQVDMIMLTYFDRGGTNSPVFATIEEVSPATVERIMAEYIKVVELYETTKTLPSLMPLTFKMKDGKVTAKKNWQCDYCDFCGPSCEGWPEFDRKNYKVVGKIADGMFDVYDKWAHIADVLYADYEIARSKNLELM